MTTTRTFHLERDTDVSGISGTGTVADGAVFPDGTTVIRWRGERQSTVVWPTLDDVEAIHGHGGATRIVWDHVDGPPAPDLSRLTEMDGYLEEYGAENLIAFWREIRDSIRRPVREWMAARIARGGAA